MHAGVCLNRHFKSGSRYRVWRCQPAFPNVLPRLRSLHAAGFRVLIVSNESTDRLRQPSSVLRAMRDKTRRLDAFAAAAAVPLLALVAVRGDHHRKPAPGAWVRIGCCRTPIISERGANRRSRRRFKTHGMRVCRKGGRCRGVLTAVLPPHNHRPASRHARELLCWRCRGPAGRPLGLRPCLCGGSGAPLLHRGTGAAHPYPTLCFLNYNP